eukprot:gene12855-biopygen11204
MSFADAKEPPALLAGRHAIPLTGWGCRASYLHPHLYLFLPLKIGTVHPTSPQAECEAAKVEVRAGGDGRGRRGHRGGRRTVSFSDGRKSAGTSTSSSRPEWEMHAARNAGLGPRLHPRRRPRSGGARADGSDSEGEEEVEVPALWEARERGCAGGRFRTRGGGRGRGPSAMGARPRRPGPLPLPPVRQGNRPPTTSVAAAASAVASCPHLDLGCLALRLRRGWVHSSDFEGEEEVEVGVEVRRYGRLTKKDLYLYPPTRLEEWRGAQQAALEVPSHQQRTSDGRD